MESLQAQLDQLKRYQLEYLFETKCFRILQLADGPWVKFSDLASLLARQEQHMHENENDLTRVDTPGSPVDSLTAASTERIRALIQREHRRVLHEVPYGFITAEQNLHNDPFSLCPHPDCVLVRSVHVPAAPQETTPRDMKAFTVSPQIVRELSDRLTSPAETRQPPESIRLIPCTAHGINWCEVCTSDEIFAAETPPRPDRLDLEVELRKMLAQANHDRQMFRLEHHEAERAIRDSERYRTVAEILRFVERMRAASVPPDTNKDAK